MQHICAPWRSEYFSQKVDGCVFCDVINRPEDDDKTGVLFRAKHCFCVMNLFPYSPGHFMVIPFKHTDKIEDLDETTWQEMSYFVRCGVQILKRELRAEGVNIGMNLGAAAGAGIAEHVHYHLVPRWNRDTNFITTIADVRVNGVPFHPLFEKLKRAFGELA
ncbi:HIT domain-containing protein [Campylobacter sp. faydin G-24]|uniref:HIT domain-containing protein n=1 Tax=Campylobacter anatolicus TaxID=2829105 RepID=A0ABS5HJ68_9BACT|nr:HIT domain-containing protein [Campylobacter anatolicus]MBR8462773.1 HIT domain-containing protein [Campylobacter anatolicus]MBR8464060.1 HIT domain-containing protein [Campylobacter anatolicus]MBR8465965.1 HIT domain-containing protein [Campylobacter anatolicus]